MLTKEWIITHHVSVANLFPREWECPSLDDILKLGLHLKLNGINWTTNEELAEAMVDLHEIGLLISTRDDQGRIVFKVNTDFKISEDTYGFAT